MCSKNVRNQPNSNSFFLFKTKSSKQHIEIYNQIYKHSAKRVILILFIEKIFYPMSNTEQSITVDT